MSYTREDILRDIWVRRALATVTFPDEGVHAFSRFSGTFNEARAYFQSLPSNEIESLRRLVQEPVRGNPEPSTMKTPAFRGSPSRPMPPSPKGSCCRR